MGNKKKVHEAKEKIKACEETKSPNKNQIDEQNRTLRNVFIVFGAIALTIVLVVLFINSVRHFEYEGVEFNVVKEGEIIFYNAVFPIHSMTGRHIADYNFYIRNDPRKLDKIPFDGRINLLDILVINASEDFNCDGDGIIAIANLIKVYEFAGTKVMKDENATCDTQGRYMFVQIQPGNVTGIKQFGPACYNLYVNNCEILKATERLMLETFVDINEN